jgi:hypothetical protein
VILKVTNLRTKSIVWSKKLFATLETSFHYSVIRHNTIIPQLERMNTAFPDLKIERL